MKKYAIIVAAGSGTRMGTEIPKQFLMLAGKPLLYHTVKAFLHSFADLQVVLVVNKNFVPKTLEVIAELNTQNRIEIVEGGETRFQSVRNGLGKVEEPSIVFVHDGVRCMVSKQLIERCSQIAMAKGSAIPAVTATDSIRIVVNGTNQVADRNNVFIIQTPQTFKSGILLEAFKQQELASFTDEASVVEANGGIINLVEGEYDNIKVTRPVDLLIAAQIMEQRLTLQ